MSSKVFVIEIIGSVRKIFSGVRKKEPWFSDCETVLLDYNKRKLEWDIQVFLKINNSQKGQTIDCTLSQYSTYGL